MSLTPHFHSKHPDDPFIRKHKDEKKAAEKLLKEAVELFASKSRVDAKPDDAPPPPPYKPQFPI